MRDETPAQTTARLLDVIAHAELEVRPGLYACEPLGDGLAEEIRHRLGLAPA
ncbi:MAG TPA: hypothetical protein VGX21_16060 [Methylomirabilota bacterium]|jgi:hypothetical protein|nr:hypothetical protein [Methylomirabilota bacterium]